ncbi:hypothetical protein ACVMAJ_006839 [Bradyrhizobium sp. USDA 4448]
MGDDDDEHFHGPWRSEALIWRESAEQAVGKPALQAYEPNITHTDTRWLPNLRSRASLDQALRGNGELLGDRVRRGAVSHDEREFVGDLVIGRIRPGKGLHNQRVAKVRRRRVAEFISRMKRENPEMQLEAIVAYAMKRFRVTRSGVFTSIKEHKSVVIITNDQVAARAEELAKASGKHFLDHIAEARGQLEGEVASESNVPT